MREEKIAVIMYLYNELLVTFNTMGTLLIKIFSMVKEKSNL